MFTCAFRFFLLPLIFFSPEFSVQAQYSFLENGNALLQGGDRGFFLDAPTRTTIDLAGPWLYAVENGPKGTVKVPSAFDFHGRVAFERTFTLDTAQVDQYRYSLVLLGVSHSCEVSVNGEYIGSHAGGFTTFVEPIPRNLLQPGSDNVVRVNVTNLPDAKTTLPLRPDVWGMRSYGGITRDAFLLGTPTVYIRNAVILSNQSENGQSVRMVARIIPEGDDSLTAAAQGGQVKVPLAGFFFEIVDRVSGASLARSPVVPVTRKGRDWDTASAELTLQSPLLWTPETPELYLVRCSLVRAEGKDLRLLDEYDVVTGIRKIAVAGGHMLLNGKRLIVRGVTWYEDHPSCGSAMTYEDREKDIVFIKNLGANLVRFAGHPPHPYMLSLCDRYGLLAMEEIPLTQTPGGVMAAEGYGELAVAAMREMMSRDRNHPSVLAWGLGDEFDTSYPEARSFVENLVKTARSLDNRPLFFGALPGAQESCTDLVDIAAINVHTQDIRSFKTLLESWKSSHRKQPVIVSKFGCEVQQDNHNGYSDPLSQEAQARFYLQRFDILRSLDYDGGIVWSFNDWKGDRPSLTVHTGNPWMHTLGLVSVRRDRRLAYDAVRSVFRDERFVALPMGTHSSSAPIIYVFAGFVLLIGVAYMYNSSRRFRESVNRSMLNSYNFFADVRDQRSVSAGHTTLLGIVVALADALVISSLLYRFRESLVLDNILSYLLVSDRAKEVAIALVWDPMKFILVGALMIFVSFLLVAGGINLLRAFTRQKISPYHAYTVTMWSTTPLLVFIPIGMVLFRALETAAYVLPTLIIVGILSLWVFLRLLKGTSIVADIFPLKVYSFGVLIIVGVCTVAYFYYDYYQAAPMHISYLLSSMIHSD